MKSIYKEQINSLIKLKKSLVHKLDILMYEYNEFRKFFRTEDGSKAKEKANMRYYSYMYDLCDVGPYEEGKFSLHHKELTTRMQENKNERIKLMSKIKEIKLQIKQTHKTIQINYSK